VAGESEEETPKWRRRFAAEANNTGWSLVELVDRTPAQTEEMLDAAHASAHLWKQIGTDLHRARSQLLLGLAHGLAGNGTLATRYATASFDYFTRHECPDWEIAFAHAAMACAAGAAGNVADHGKHYGEAARLGVAIADAEDRAIFKKTFDRVPKDRAQAV
jgi:hypothetical protein